MIYEIKWTNKFQKSYKIAKKRGLDISLLEDVIDKLRRGVPLADKNRDHE